MSHNGEYFEPSDELQDLIDAARREQLEARRAKDWTSGRGVVLEKGDRYFPLHPAYSYTAARSLTSCSGPLRAVYR